MSKTEAFRILGAQNAPKAGDTSKKEAMLRPQNVVRRKLADISNLPESQRLSIQQKSQLSETTSTEEYIEQLQKENMALGKILAQRNKIIEQSGIELERLRVTLLKMHEQNQQLALSNSQMLAELNTGKDRLKLLQHELGCKSGLLKAKQLQFEGAKTKPCKDADAEGAKTKPCKDADVELLKFGEVGESFKEGTDDEKPRKAKRNLVSNGLDPSEQPKDNIQNKRRFSRRQSARFIAAEVKPAEDLSETNNRTEVSLSQLPDDKEQSENKRCLVRRHSSRLKAAEIKTAEDAFEANSTEISASQLPDDIEQTEIKRCLVRRHSSRSKAAEKKTAEDAFEANSTEVSASQLPDDREQTEIKRPSRRCQSARLKTAEVDPAENSTETNGTTVSESKLPEDTILELGSTSDSALVKNEGNIVGSASKYEPQGFGRSSLSRPSRAAATKVQSYKEIPLNVKMRRSA